MPGLLRSFSPTDSMKPLAGSTVNVDEIEINRRDQHFNVNNKYGALVDEDAEKIEQNRES
jgi:hypothetical protein